MHSIFYKNEQGMMNRRDETICLRYERRSGVVLQAKCCQSGEEGSITSSCDL